MVVGKNGNAYYPNTAYPMIIRGYDRIFAFRIEGGNSYNNINFRPTIAVIDEKPSENIVISADVTTPRNTIVTGNNNGVPAGPITVTINYGDTDLQKQYKEGAEGEWITVNESVKQLNNITSNKTIYARYYDGKIGTKVKSYKIANVDNVSPEFKACYINVENNAEIGVYDVVEDTTLKYYFSKDNENTWEETSTIPIITSKNSTGLYSIKAIDEAGNSTIIKLTQDDEGIPSKYISTNADEFYGKEINNYTCTNSAGVNAWKIFYANNNIYLIADDYIHYNYCPPSATQTISASRNKPYIVSMNYVINDYSGTSNITDGKIKALNNDYFNKGYTSDMNNIKATAYMLDTNAWSTFAGNKAEYAIGGPTIEMIMKSYSQKYNVAYIAQAKSNIGYEISKDNGENWSSYYVKMFDISDNLYVISNSLKAEGMWIASPSYYNAYNMMALQLDGNVTNYSYSNNNLYGFRPVVCLKSDIKLQKNSDGTYAIK